MAPLADTVLSQTVQSAVGTRRLPAAEDEELPGERARDAAEVADNLVDGVEAERGLVHPPGVNAGGAVRNCSCNAALRSAYGALSGESFVCDAVAEVSIGDAVVSEDGG